MKEKQYLAGIGKDLQQKYKRGVRLLERGEYLEAEENFAELREKIPAFVPLYNKWAIIYIHRQDYGKARDLLEEALALDGEYAPAICNLGNIARAEGNLELAKEYYLKAIEIDEEYGPAYNNLGVVYREEGDIKRSVKYLKRANKYRSYYPDLAGNPAGCIIPLLLGLIALIFLFYIMR
ncbi:MAG: tetratricopeptide repeat protein [Halanaerobiaceae bacterium]|nr:tetratricopeptide repeat protein [Halanaerobiaceae bacterium]